MISCFYLAFLQVTFTEREPEIYLIPMTWLSNEQLQVLTDRHPLATITALSLGDVEGVLCDAVYFEEFRELLLELVSRHAKVHGADGSELVGQERRSCNEKLSAQDRIISEQGCAVEQNNTSILYGDRLLFKMYRKLEDGINPEPEILRFLTGKKRFRNAPAYAGEIEYRCRRQRV